ncbi:MAG: hypothetical protein JKY71_10025 [Alphaproteobacteria bacterium]|nr:hypothetical protein [Alphaproteobacteria bacterium]
MMQTADTQRELPLELPEGSPMRMNPESYDRSDYPLDRNTRAFSRKFYEFTSVDMKFKDGDVYATLTAFEDHGKPGSVPVDYGVGEEQFRELSENLQAVRDRLVADFTPDALESRSDLGRDFRDITGGISLCETALTKFSAITPQLIDSIKQAGAEEYRADTLAGKTEALVDRVRGWMPGNDGLS